ncbi:MAG: proline--tRNA ligase [Candidatus Diapherotrites archaeon]|nr:proline--tRNA ligase [Candidatus Diapherotrites archaeon]
MTIVEKHFKQIKPLKIIKSLKNKNQQCIFYVTEMIFGESMRKKFEIDKNKDFSEWYNEIIKQTEMVDQRYGVKGFIVHRPWATIALKQLFRTFEEQLEANDHQPVLFPVVIPESLLKLEGEHVKAFEKEVFWVTHGGENKLAERMCLRPTSETAFYSLYSLWVRSYRDLPIKYYQSVAVYRHETKATRPLIRGREFLFIETHCVFKSMEDADNRLKEDMEISEEVLHKKLGLPFLVFKRPEWDKFPGAEYSHATDTLMPDLKVMQLSSTHNLGQKFSKPFDIKFKNESEKEEFAYQTCYGPGIWRILAAIVSVHGDNHGLIMPWEIAPYQVIIVPIYSSETKKHVLEKATQLLEELRSNGLRVHVDDSENTPGWKFSEWEMKGVPIRVELGPRDIKNKSAVVVRRDTKEKKNVKLEKLFEEITRQKESIADNMRKKADKALKDNLHNAKTTEELLAKAKLGGIVRINFCGSQECADKIQDMTGLEVRGTLARQSEKPNGKCAMCGKEAKKVTYLAKAY